MDNTVKLNKKLLSTLTESVIQSVIGRSANGRLVAARMLIDGGETLSVVAEKTGLALSEVESLLKRMQKGL